MIFQFIPIITAIVTSWICLFLIFSGIGGLIRRLTGLKIQGFSSWVESFWLGWAFVLAFLQIWHLWVKIDWPALALVCGVGITGLVINRSEIWELFKSILKRYLPASIIFIAVTFWLADLAIGPVQNTDTGLYHLPVIKWIMTYPIVPGLGNLHVRLAFNSAYFLYAALLNSGPVANIAHHLANGLLLFVVLGQIFFHLKNIVLNKKHLQIVDLYYALLLAPVIAQFTGDNLTSFSPDLPIFILGMILSGKLLEYITNNDLKTNEERYTLFWITAAACTGIIIKTTFLAFGGTAILVALAVFIHRHREHLRQTIGKTLLAISAAILILIGPWVVRGIITSGYIAFPIRYGSFSLKWSVPPAVASYEANAIRAYARKPVISKTDIVFGNIEWLQPWIEKLPSDITRPVQFTLIGLMLASIAIGSSQIHRRKYAGWNFLFPSIAAIGFWFISAPAYRFAGSAFWVIAAGTLSLSAYLMNFLDEKNMAISQALCLIFFILSNPIRSPLAMAPYSMTEVIHPLPKYSYHTKKTQSGIKINIPDERDQCWNTPLPCSPYFYPNLKLLNPTDMSKGFWMEQDTPPQEY